MTIMYNEDIPVLKDVVLVGAGHAHLQVLQRFGADPVPGVRLTLITPEMEKPYPEMLPGLICGHYVKEDLYIDLLPLAHFADARLYHSVVTGLDTNAHRVICNNRPPVAYDVLSIDIGSTPQAVPGAVENVIPMKPVDTFVPQFEALIQRTRDATGPRHIAMVGAGRSGVELLLAVEHRLRAEAKDAGRNPAAVVFSLVSSSPDILPGIPDKVRERFMALLNEHNIHIIAGAPVTAVEPGVLRFETHAPLDVDEVLWATSASAPHWLKETGLPLDEKGFIKVDAALLVNDAEDIFAAGDVMAFPDETLPKNCAFAVHSGPALADNIRRFLMGKRLKAYKPQRNAMPPITAGDRFAIGMRKGMLFASRGMWRLKNRIDARFINPFHNIPPLGIEEDYNGLPAVDEKTWYEIIGDGLRCGGAGAKVGPAVLGRALGSIRPLKRPEVLAGLDVSDDAAVTDLGNELLSVQSVDYFRTMIDDPFIFGKIAANHALNDIYAMGANPETALAIVGMPYGLARKTEIDLADLLTGANEVLSEAGCSLAGGHTAETAELSLGFSVTGVVPRERILHKSAAHATDLLVLTKPLGTGALFAADMRGKAEGRWITQAIAHMLQSNRTAATIFLRHGIRAVTDVAGFGLLGHLVEMLRASKTAAILRLDALKVLPGVKEILEEGVHSSLYQQNLWMRRVIRMAENLAHPLYPILFDPQTSGGLLAAVPRGVLNAVMNDLNIAGYTWSAVVGEIIASDGATELVSLRL